MPGTHRVEHRDRGTVYWYAYRGGPLIWAGRTDDELGAKDDILRAYEDEIMQKPATGVISRVIADYRASADFLKLARTTKDLYHIFLEQADQRLGHLSLAEYAGGEGRRLIREWRKDVAGKSPRTADQVKSVVSAFTAWGRREDVLPLTCRPTADMPRLYSAPPQEAWTRGEIARAAFWLPGRLGDALLLALETGLRRADLCALTWAAIDERAGMIRWHTSKGRKHGRMARIALTPSLRAVLRRIRARNDAEIGPLLLNVWGKPWQASALGHAIERALDRLGIDKRLHGLRRTTATHLAAQGRSSREIANQLGWSESEAEAMAAVYVDEEQIVNERVNSL